MKTDLLACRHIGVNKADAEVIQYYANRRLKS